MENTTIQVDEVNSRWLNRLKYNLGEKTINGVVTKLRKIVLRFKLASELKETPKPSHGEQITSDEVRDEINSMENN